MAGLAEILEENARLRALLEARDAELRQREAALAAQAEAHALERDEWARQLALNEQIIEVLQQRAEELARALELLALKTAGPASERFVSEENTPEPFVSDIAPPPRAPVSEPASETEADAHSEEPATPKKRGTPRRPRLQDGWKGPRRTVRCRATPNSACVRCGSALSVIGQAVSYRVEWEPGRFVLEEVLRDKCACRACPGEGVLTVPGPYVLPRAQCGNGLLARVLVDKFADHLPLHRQVRRLSREGFETNSTTLSSWVLGGANWLKVIAGAVRDELFAQRVLLGDDTGFPVQDGEDGHLRKGRLWAFTDQQQVLYAFSATKHGEHPAALLEGFEGKVLLVDGGSEFNQSIREQGLERAGCWSHLRRYFYDARHHHPNEATLALGTIRDLFLLERELRDRPPDEILAIRQARARPLVDGLYVWIEAQSAVNRPASKLGEALRYAKNQEAEMRVFLSDGAVPMNNNLSELMLRQAVVGRKNWLFARSEGGAEAACVLYTLIGSCMLQGIDPHAYLVDILGRLPDHPANCVHELTPMAWRRARETHASRDPIGMP